MTNNNLGLYIHIPFCQRKCNYCDFYSVTPNDKTKEGYINSLVNEIKKWGEHTACPIDTMYIGGGTPSLLNRNELAAIFAATRQYFKITDNAEITIEINPGDNAQSFLEYAAKLGVNRVSVGVQSFCENELCTLGRRHNANDAKAAVYVARKCGIKNISADIMIGLPDSTKETLQKSIEGVLSLGTEHISAYILKVEPNTPFAKSSLNLPDDDKTAEQYLQLCKSLRAAGYDHYEISNFSKKGFESRHNNRYWKQEEYIGIGPSAHSFFGGKRFFYPRDIDKFLESAETVFDDYGGDWQEFVMLALRLSSGLNFREFESRFSKPLASSIINEAHKLAKHGFCEVYDDRISLTDEGMLVSNTIISTLIGAVNENI